PAEILALHFRSPLPPQVLCFTQSRDILLKRHENSLSICCEKARISDAGTRDASQSKTLTTLLPIEMAARSVRYRWTRLPCMSNYGLDCLSSGIQIALWSHGPTCNTTPKFKSDAAIVHSQHMEVAVRVAVAMHWSVFRRTHNP